MRSSLSGWPLALLVVVMAPVVALGLWTLLFDLIAERRAQENVRDCQARLRRIAAALRDHVNGEREGRWPQESGIRLLLQPWRAGEVEGPELEMYVCPGTNDQTWPVSREGEWGAGFEAWDAVQSECISYAGRDLRRFPIEAGHEHEAILAADDNEFVCNHEGITNVVYADGRVEALDWRDFADQLEEGMDYLPVGPGSPHPELRKLMVD